MDARKFFKILDTANQPLYRKYINKHLPLSSTNRLIILKTNYNLPEKYINTITNFIRNILPENNFTPYSYYKIPKLIADLNLPYQIKNIYIEIYLLKHIFRLK